MRHLLVQVPTGHGDRVAELARECEAMNVVQQSARSERGDVELIIFDIDNRRTGELLQEIEPIPRVHISFAPSAVLALEPPTETAPEQVREATWRSPVEVYLQSLHSIGSWRGFLTYASAAAIVLWIGMTTETIFFLLSAMLIAPFAGPVMAVAISSATGDRTLFQRSVGRYFAAIAVTVAWTYVITWLSSLNNPTGLMITLSHLTSTAFILPIAAGAAGAINLVEAEYSSLVSGAAAGVLVAAALAPPAGLIGIALRLQTYDLALRAAFVLLLQLIGINLSGSAVFRMVGLSASGGRYDQGQSKIFYLSVALTAVALAGLLYWQFSEPINLQRSTVERRINDRVASIIEDNTSVDLLDLDGSLTREEIDGQETYLATVYAQRREDAILEPELLEDMLKRQIEINLLQEWDAMKPYIQVNVLEQPTIQETEP